MGGRRIALVPNEGEARRIAIALPVFWVAIGAFAVVSPRSPGWGFVFFLAGMPAVLITLVTAYGIFARETGRTSRQVFFPLGGLDEGDSVWRLQLELWKAQLRMMSATWFMSVARATRWNHRIVAGTFALGLGVGLGGIVYNWTTIS